MKISKHGFTLIELLVAIAIIGILAGVVLVSMSGYGKKARSTKALAQVSSVIPSMVSCWGNEGDVVIPDNSGENVCQNSSGSALISYGTWPLVGSGTGLANYSYNWGGAVQAISKNGNSVFNDKLTWYISMLSNATNDNVKICCNSTMGGCGIIGAFNDGTQVCSASKTW